MGQLMVKLAEPLQHCSDSVANILARRRKRKRSIDSRCSSDELKHSETQSPKKKKLLTTTQYIYQALFKEQKNSDIAVMALGKVWNLHKVYLCQSPYFYSMFNGSWKESCQDFVHIKILDDRITLEALDAVFGSMYSDEIEIDPKAVISVLATATLFHLDGIIDKCAEVMIETINTETAISYYEAACLYGSVNVKKAAMVWLETNLLCIYPKDDQLLRQISVELMTKLIASPDLYVMQTEFSLYTLLRSWMYLRLHPQYDPENSSNIMPSTADSDRDRSNSSIANSSNNSGDSPTLGELIQAYFANRREKRPFLATPEGQPFVPPFQALRTQYLTNHHTDLKIVLNDNIIPKEWLHSHVLSHWHSILRVDHLPEEGPQDLDPDVFYKNCMRCGRILLEPGYQKWRWTGFNFGLDLVLVADSRLLSIRRHHRNEHERLLSLQTKRQFMIRTSVTSINSQRQPTFTQKTDITSLSLEKNQEVTIMLMDTKLVHPLLISVNLLVVSPTSQQFKQNILTNEEMANAAAPISEIGANCNPAGDEESLQRPSTPTNATPSSERMMMASADDSAVCVVPPSPPNALPMLVLQPTHRAASTTSTVSTASSVSSAFSVASAASSSASDFV
ncbi:protein germ cell-less [Anastrepha obliqua]|uniref:protein germ cell-less n=1 Tax=Anastrepha obliqua TaxID=95512 RepID=UPI00240A226C|nr:protein germ cell-less [Anastrepha obliqua]XP_054736822.1 protein germ cell-less [Anastrepha obliqua]